MTGRPPHTTATAEDESDEPDICVICLEPVLEPGTARPCSHDQFHFSCLGSWLRNNTICPLCKQGIAAISYESAGKTVDVVLAGPSSISDCGRTTRSSADRENRQSWRDARRSRNDSNASTYSYLAFRRRVYEDDMRCTHVGSNATSGYRSITPAAFSHDQQLVSKAKRWLRRELQVFDFPNFGVPRSTSPRDRSSINAEYLLEYIVLMLKSIAIKDSSGQAEALLAEHIGRRHAQILLHELESWLRSPYAVLRDWDDNVQY